MPKLPMDYSKCCIYRIEHVDDEKLVYVGHTTSFDKRKTEHKNSCKNGKCKQHNYKLYQMIRENGGWDMFKMIEVEKYPCNDRREAERRENEVMKELKANMNIYSSFRTEEENKDKKREYYELNKPKIQQQKKEYQEEHKEKIQEYNKEYYEANKHTIQERNKEYRENNKPKIQEKNKEYYESNKPKIQENLELNKEIMKEYNQVYRESNKDKINAKVKCECNCEVVKRHLKRHQSTKKHLDKMIL